MAYVGRSSVPLTTLSRGGHVAPKKAVQRIRPRYMTRFGDEICADASSNIPDGASAMLACDMAMRLRKTLGSSLEYLLASVCGRHSPNEFSCAHDHAARWSATQTCAQFPDHPKPKWVVWRGKSGSADTAKCQQERPRCQGS